MGRIVKYLPTLIAALLGASCVATDVGNPQDEPEVATVELSIVALEDEVPNALVLDDGLTLTHAWVVTKRLRFEACEAAEGEERAEELNERQEWEEVVATDLLSGTSLPRVPRLQQPAGGFCSFEAEVHSVTLAELPAGAPRELAGHSMFVRGLRKDGSPFEVFADFTEQASLEGDLQVPVGSSQWMLGFAVNSWLSQSDVAALEGVPPLRIDDDENSDVLDRFVENARRSIRLGRDVDGDRTFDGDELLELSRGESGSE